MGGGGGGGVNLHPRALYIPHRENANGQITSKVLAKALTITTTTATAAIELAERLTDLERRCAMIVFIPVDCLDGIWSIIKWSIIGCIRGCQACAESHRRAREEAKQREYEVGKETEPLCPDQTDVPIIR